MLMRTSEPTRALVTAAGATLLTPAALLAVLRLARLEQFRLVILAETFTPVLFLPAYPMLVAGLLTRHRLVAAVAAALIACHLAWLAPELAPARSLPAGAAAAPKLRLLDQNVLGTANRTPHRLRKQIREVRPDVIVLQEVEPGFLAALDADGTLTGYPHRFTPAGINLAVLSARPLTDRRVLRTGPNSALRVTMELAGGPVALYNVHPPAPLFVSAPAWLGAYRDLRQELHAQTGPVIVAGDFNATWYHRPFRDLVSAGYREAHQDLGRGYARSWPVRNDLTAGAGGLIRIDHVLTRAVRAIRITELDPNGSDHRPLVADLVRD